MNIEDKILKAAHDIFLFYGYHGSTLQLIATKSMVNKSIIHYYFRSKEKLYSKFIASVFDYLVSTDFTYFENLEENRNILWFLTTEQYNNKILFEKTLTNLYPDDIESRKNYINKWIEIVSLYHLNRFELKK